MTQQLVWIGISIAISFTLSMFLPIYLALPLMIGIFIGLNYYLRRRMMRRMGMSMPTFGGGNSLSFYCMNCGTKHNQTECPRCGSKMKRAGF
jgi:hypothetical protein